MVERRSPSGALVSPGLPNHPAAPPESEPPSQVRPLTPPPGVLRAQPLRRMRLAQPVGPGDSRALIVGTALRGAEAEAAWVTVSDPAGRSYFEGPLSPDGCVTVAIPTVTNCGNPIERVLVRLETVRGHRQAEVAITARVSAYTFA